MSMKEAVRKRGLIKAKLTRFGTFFNAFHANEERKPTELRLRLEKLEGLFDEFDVIQTDIEVDEESNEQTKERIMFEDEFFSIQAAAVDELARREQSSNLNKPREGEMQLRLPKINLPEFSGEYENWQFFRDNFTIMIHNTRIPAIQKLQYLRLCLKGNAAQLIETLEVSEVNYAVAWKLVQERFENKRLIVQTHVSKLFGVPKIERELATELRQFFDTFTRHLGALKAFGEPTDSWSTLLVHLASSKLDNKSLVEWERSRIDTSVPTWTEFNRFLSHRCQTLAAIEVSSKSLGGTTSYTPATTMRRSFTVSQTNGQGMDTKCYVCKLKHALYQCPRFLALRTPDKVKAARAANACVNCLKGGHRASACRSAGCQKCNKRHNSKLHLEDEEKEEAFANNVLLQDDQTKHGDEGQEDGVKDEETLISLKAQSSDKENQKREMTVLSTALVIINDRRGNGVLARVLLDSGSQANLMTSKLTTKLGFPVSGTTTTVTGISGLSCQPVGETNVVVKSRMNGYTANLKFLVLQNVAGTLPSLQMNPIVLDAVKRAECADPDVGSRRKIDVILGSEVFFELLCIGQVKPVGTRAIWQKTVFGWILSGLVSSQRSTHCLSAIITEAGSLQEQIKGFWEIEEVIGSPLAKKRSTEEKQCEAHFVSTCRRENNGRFVLKLPFRKNVKQLGESFPMAEKWFYAMERKLEANSELKHQYLDFMREYHKLGHMKLKTTKGISAEQPQVFLPHHAVIRQESTTTKLRVVFDASSPTATSVSLNDTLMVGPTIQDDLRSILLRFRIHSVVMTADIEKMYRQISVSSDCQSYQQILWRENPTDPLECYQLQTVTYGTTAAPFMAIRTLHQLAECEKENFEKASPITKRDFYVDDLLTGAANVEEAADLQGGLLKMCERGGFTLRKWCSNRDELLNRVPNAMRAASHDIKFREDNSTKTLGVRWKPKEDELHYVVQVAEPLTRTTKRVVVSEMSRLFDPLGLVSPVIVKAKMFVQQLWRLKLSWDESLPIEHHTAWERYRSELVNVTKINIPRNVISTTEIRQQELHIFCDASLLAYGACAYMRVVYKTGGITSRLLVAKSRVCPLKATTIPRLELCAALLGSKLMLMVTTALKEILKLDRIVLWTDSMIVLNWIQSERSSDNWKTFVANRIEEIRAVTSGHSWRHIDGEENPADLLSRGQGVDEIRTCSRWWTGPTWITTPEGDCPAQDRVVAENELLEKRKEVIVLQGQTEVKGEFFEIVYRFSKLERLQRVTAYMFRALTVKKNRIAEEINTVELHRALMYWVRKTQAVEFSNEIKQLKKGNPLINSKLQSLVPFIDEEELLRVGGRLQNSLEPYGTRHPILLPSTAYLVQLIVDQEHRRLMHAGPQQIIASLQRTFWILGLRKVVQKTIFKCNPCYRWKIQASRQLMGSLPADRVTPSTVFHTSGVDYAGPFQIRHGSQRSRQIHKSYIAIFVCFSTKAVHLEWVDDLTSESFLATLRIFVARRGCPSQIYSDNGRNFLGAAAKLKTFLASSELKQIVTNYVAQTGIRWSFIPPHSPHIGGLWEAGVKSMKFHLRRNLGESILNHQEAKTVLAQIEAVLNSRPLTPASTNPGDMEVLTPGHFIIGKPLTALPEPNYLDVKSPRLRWHMVQQLVQGFWKRWRTEYLHSLQVRHKWSQAENNLAVGDFVLIREDYETPLAWSRGRILSLQPGSDGLVRVATIRTPRSEVKRPIHKLCLLPKRGNSLNLSKV